MATEYDPAMAGDRWQSAISLEVHDLASSDPPDSVNVEIEQVLKGKPSAQLVIVTGYTSFALVNVSPRELERLADLCNEAASMIRLCSESSHAT
jgi:hypothetical protein